MVCRRCCLVGERGPRCALQPSRSCAHIPGGLSALLFRRPSLAEDAAAEGLRSLVSGFSTHRDADSRSSACLVTPRECRSRRVTLRQPHQSESRSSVLPPKSFADCSRSQLLPQCCPFQCSAARPGWKGRRSHQLNRVSSRSSSRSSLRST
jgi:hypothetical protein